MKHAVCSHVHRHSCIYRCMHGACVNCLQRILSVPELIINFWNLMYTLVAAFKNVAKKQHDCSPSLHFLVIQSTASNCSVSFFCVNSHYDILNVQSRSLETDWTPNSDVERQLARMYFLSQHYRITPFTGLSRHSQCKDYWGLHALYNTTMNAPEGNNSAFKCNFS
jgi:hypothetical protein